MTKPNKALADWLLRKLFKLQEREILTRERMLLLGFDCVIIYKEAEGKYRIDVQPLGQYDAFIEEVALEP